MARRHELRDGRDETAERVDRAYDWLAMILRILRGVDPDEMPRPWLLEQARAIAGAEVTVEQPPPARSPADESLYVHTDWTRPTRAERRAADELLAAVAASTV